MHRYVASLTALIILATYAARLPAKSFVYVSLAGENAIAVWSMDEESGDLEYLSRVEVEGEPGGLTTDPQRKFLFASLRSAGKIASFKIPRHIVFVEEMPVTPSGKIRKIELREWALDQIN